MAAAGKQKEIPMGYPAHPTKPKTTFCLNIRTLRESKNRFRFVTSGTPRSRKQLSISISGYSANQNADSVSLPRTFHEAENNFLSRSPDTPRNQKRISISIPRHYAKRKTNLDFDLRVLWKQKMNLDFAFRVSGKPKMNCDFAFWVLRKAKMNLDFASRSVRKPKMNCDFASLSVRSRQNELRFCFPECL